MADRDTALKVLSDNRQAGHNYFLMDRFEAGMVLTGTEVKAAKDSKIQLKEAYAAVLSNEAWLVNAHISQYSHGNRENHPPIRNRKLLLHRREIDKLLVQTRDKGLPADSHQDYLKKRPDQVRAGGGQGQETARQARDRTQKDRRRRGARGNPATGVAESQSLAAP